MLEIGVIRLPEFEFPGRAGALQREGAIPALVRELGDNYAKYHAALAAALIQRGGRPNPAAYDDRNYKGGSQNYLMAFERAREIVLAEALLRNCRAYRVNGRPLSAPVETDVPLLDSADRLLSVE